MLSIQKILVPVVFTDTSQHVVHQAAWLARRFHAEMILLHVVTPLSYPVGWLEGGHEITARDLHAHIVQRAQKDLDQALQPELDGIAVKHFESHKVRPRHILQRLAASVSLPRIIFNRHWSQISHKEALSGWSILLRFQKPKAKYLVLVALGISRWRELFT